MNLAASMAFGFPGYHDQSAYYPGFPGVGQDGAALGGKKKRHRRRGRRLGRLGGGRGNEDDQGEEEEGEPRDVETIPWSGRTADDLANHPELCDHAIATIASTTASAEKKDLVLASPPR